MHVCEYVGWVCICGKDDYLCVCIYRKVCVHVTVCMYVAWRLWMGMSICALLCTSSCIRVYMCEACVHPEVYVAAGEGVMRA